MYSPSNINIVLSSDNNYAQHLGVTLCSIFENNEGEILNISVIASGISQDNKQKLAQVEKRYGFKINYITPDINMFKDLFLSGHVSEATYYRFSIGELLPQSIEKVLYLDCDIVVLGKISELWDTDLGDNIIGAITEAGYVNYFPLSIKSKVDYFNAGVLFINLKKWRENNIGKKCFDFIKQNPEKIILHDQDTLNGVFCGKWKKLDKKFNVMAQEESKIKQPVIIHYNTSVKPWNYLCNNPQKSQYYKYLTTTPWRDYKPRFPTLIEFVKYYYYIFFDQNTRVKIRKHILVPLGFRKGV